MAGPVCFCEAVQAHPPQTDLKDIKEIRLQVVLQFKAKHPGQALLVSGWPASVHISISTATVQQRLKKYHNVLHENPNFSQKIRR